ncbi:hypothetical protein SAMN04488034_101412 [Salinimicrobium catena]|uniref:ABC-2 type transport system permease protein n=1 Tax=Salinimicrobium catena TaxID=390640 RepID=A0A1H5IEX3_9FLAO|nr:DUF5687 family protein [Salinimicrobium catena]SDK77252.1 hypothetical protein SAMN04488140_101412 [Salinimicrobium catena]SEE38773.1 hypothetical protein SAMN04488034_101412 [Salinimicrobium catena]
MFKYFISLQWKAFVRSSSFGKSLGLKILMGFLVLYFSVAFLFLGLGLYPLLKEFYPEEEPLHMVNQFLLLWFFLELVVRFMIQTLPVISIKPLMATPIPKRKVVDYVLVKSLFSFFNFLPLLVILPFGIFTIYKSEFSPWAVLGWMVAVFSLDLCVNYANFLLKKYFADNLKALLPYLGVALALWLLEYFGIWSITEAFASGFDFIVENPLFSLIPVFMLLSLYLWNRKVLESRFYLDESIRGKVQEANTRDFNWTRKFGDIAPFLQLDLKMIWRNKRPRTIIFMSVILLGYGLIFYPQETYQSMPSIFVFVGIFMTGIFMINFGQFIPSWDSTYFSMMMAQNIPLKKYLSSKAGLMTFSVVVLAILTTPYLYFGWKILVINFCCALFNIGVNIPVLLYAGSFNRKRIDLEKSAFMNYQGTGATQWLVALPLMIVPVLIFWGVSSFLGFQAGAGVLSGLGVMGILLRPHLMNLVEQAYVKSKYAMINGFKQTGE